MKEKGTYKIYGYNDIQRYINGEMSSAEMYALEKQSLQDPFLMDAIDGYNTVQTHITLQDLETLKTKIQPLQEAKVVSLHNVNNIAKNKFPWVKLGVAASVIGIMAFVGFQFFGKNKVDEIASKEPLKTNANVETSTSEIASSIDTTILKSLSLNGISEVTTEPKRTIFVKPDDVKSYYSKLEPTAISSNDFNIAVNDDKEKFKVSAPVVSSNADSINSNLRKDQIDVAKVEKEETKQTGEIAAAKPIEKQNEGTATNDRRMQNTNAPLNGNNNMNNTTSSKMEEVVINRNQNNVAYKKIEQAPSLNYMFNYRVTDAQGNHIPFSNISVPADQLVTYSRVDGRFGLFSSDSVLKVNIKAAGFLSQQLNLVNSNTYKNIVLTELPNTDKAYVITANKIFMLIKKVPN
jgi:hypothetical protein